MGELQVGDRNWRMCSGYRLPARTTKSTSSVRKGYVKRAPGKARGLTIVRESAAEVVDLRAVPIVGKVAGGEPVLSEENVVGEVLVDSRAVPSGGAFALEVQGDSMIGAGIHDRGPRCGSTTAAGGKQGHRRGAAG